ncbi:MAG: hypothetical protein GAK37_00354 [Pseudomonas sp.]|nr:MAG: hypothetical protein GAK37_00354 [Pseudomonas sp.]
MTSIQSTSPPSLHATSAPLFNEGVPKHSPPAGTLRFTVKEEDYGDAMDFLNDAAQWNRTPFKLDSDEQTKTDFGGGQGTYRTITVNFLPDNADGTFSQQQSNRVESTKRMFQGRMNSADISNYAPTQ